MSTGSISLVASDEGITSLAGGDHLFWWLVGPAARTNGGSLLSKILTIKNLIYLYLNFLLICKSLILRLSESIMFNIFL